MLAVILRVLTMVIGGGAVSWITSNLMVIGIAGAAVLVTNLTTGTIWYIKGYNSAASKCQVATLKRERDELKRDLGVQKSSSDFFQKKSADLEAREAQREKDGAEDAANRKPIAGCVVEPRVRKSRPQR